MLQPQDQSVVWNSDKVFSRLKGEIFIGGIRIKPDLRLVLKEQAKYLESSQIFEIIINTIKQESINMALKDSTNWDHVLSSKMLWHWGFVMENMINALKE